MSSNIFNFGQLPNEVRVSIADLLYNDEAHQLLKVSNMARNLILKRGNFPKYIEEMRLRALNEPGKEATEFKEALGIYLAYRSHNVSKEDSPKEGLWETHLGCTPPTNSLLDVNFWNQINKRIHIKKLSVFADNWCNKFCEAHKDQLEKLMELFSPIQVKRVLHSFDFDGGREFFQIFFESFDPKSVVASEISMLSSINWQNELNELGELYKKQAAKPFIKNCKFLTLLLMELSLIDGTRIASQTNAQHIRFNCLNIIPWVNHILESIVTNGIPSQNTEASCQIRALFPYDIFTEVYRMTFDEFHQSMLDKLKQKTPITVVDRSSLTKNEFLSMKRLQYFGSSRYNEWRKHHIFANRFKGELSAKHYESEEKCIYFTQMVNEEEMVGMFYLEDQKIDKWRFFDLCVIWLRKSSCIEKCVDVPFDVEKALAIDYPNLLL